jgi:SMC interacting uncharacterized protein involved in chromosome segregation
MNMEEIALKLQEVFDRAMRNEGRIKKLEGEHDVLQKLATSVAVMAEQIKTMNSNVQVLTGKVDKLEEKPAKRWDGLVDKIILTAAAAIVGFLLAHFGF